MANDKLTWVELRKAVAQAANLTEQETGQFLNALLDALVEGLKEDKQVKIKGIGTFSLKSVAPRKSVNIATGETFTIEGYNKLTFSAESMLKESVEKRLEQPKTEAVMAEINNDPIKKLGEQADEIVDILAELGQAVSKPSLEVEEVPEVSEVSEVSEVAGISEVKAEEAIEEPTIEPAPAPEEEPTEEPVEAVTEELTEEAKPIAEPIAKPTCKCHKWVCWVIGALLLLGIVGAGVYFRATLIQWWQCMQDCQPITEEVEEVLAVEEIEEVKELTLAEKPREYVNFIGIERVGKDSRLAWIAYKYYAQKDLWVFIYEANRDIIKYPAHVREGQVIRIPELSEEYRNLYNPELKQLVDSLAVEYLRK